MRLYMRLEHYPVEKLKKQILEILGRHLDLAQYRVFFFGSRVDGTAGERSDIDLGIEGPEPIPFETIVAIKEEIRRLPLLYHIDVVDFCRVASDFRAVASRHTEDVAVPRI